MIKCSKCHIDITLLNNRCPLLHYSSTECHLHPASNTNKECAFTLIAPEGVKLISEGKFELEDAKSAPETKPQNKFIAFIKKIFTLNT